MSVTDFYEIEEQRLLDEAKKVSLFTDHPSTLGQFREDLLRQYLKKFTPNLYTVKSGFIADYRGTGKDELFSTKTRQIDFLVYNKNNDVPFFETDNFAIVRPNSAFAAIEIKSSLTFYKKSLKRDDRSINDKVEGYFGKDFIYEGTLVDAMKNIMSISNIAHKYNQKLFTGIFAFDANFDPMSFFEALDFQEIQHQLGIEEIHELPFCICVPRKFFIMIDLQDMFDEKGEAAFGEGYFSLVKADESHKTLPLQFFTNIYYNNVQFSLNGIKPDTGGIFKISSGVANIFSKHFDII
jgi:hypothetical protein